MKEFQPKQKTSELKNGKQHKGGNGRNEEGRDHRPRGLVKIYRCLCFHLDRIKGMSDFFVHLHWTRSHENVTKLAMKLPLCNLEVNEELRSPTRACAFSAGTHCHLHHSKQSPRHITTSAQRIPSAKHATNAEWAKQPFYGSVCGLGRQETGTSLTKRNYLSVVRVNNIFKAWV